MSLLDPNPGIREISPYVGGKASVPGLNRVHKLSSNESALGPSPAALSAYQAAADKLAVYPEGSAAALRAAIGETHGLDPAHIVCGAGSDELITLLTQAYLRPGEEGLYSAHGFLVYRIATLANSGVAVAAPEPRRVADVDALLACVTSRTRIVFLANPNNPTGSLLGADEVARLHARLPESVLLLLDAAYAEYVDDPSYEPGHALVRRAANVVTTRTFSKIYGLAGLRVGWAHCPPAIADTLNRIRGPFNVSIPAQAAAEAAVRDQAWVAKKKAHNTRWRAFLAEQIAAAGLACDPSHGNFLLIRFPDEAGKRAADADAYLQARGLILRAVAAYGLPNALRITVGTEEQCRLAAEALHAFMSQA